MFLCIMDGCEVIDNWREIGARCPQLSWNLLQFLYVLYRQIYCVEPARWTNGFSVQKFPVSHWYYYVGCTCLAILLSDLWPLTKSYLMRNVTQVIGSITQSYRTVTGWFGEDKIDHIHTEICMMLESGWPSRCSLYNTSFVDSYMEPVTQIPAGHMSNNVGDEERPWSSQIHILKCFRITSF